MFHRRSRLTLKQKIHNRSAQGNLLMTLLITIAIFLQFNETKKASGNHIKYENSD